MTSAETFERLIQDQNTEELVDFLLALSPKDYVAIRQRSAALEREWDAGRHENGNPWKDRDGQATQLLFFLTGLVVYTRREGERIGSVGFVFLRNDALTAAEVQRQQWVSAVLDHARPGWLSGWITSTVRDNTWVAPDFDLLLDLEARGLLEPEPWLLAQAAARQLQQLSDRANLVHTLAGYGPAGKALNPAQHEMWAALQARQPALVAAATAGQSLEELTLSALQNSPALLHRGLPLLFDFDTLVDEVAARDAATKTRLAWSHFILRLVDSGHLDRGDLLTRCLLGLRRDFRRPLLTWYKELYLSLKPTADERLARQHELLELLAHPLALVANFAIGQLKDVWAEPGFATASLLEFAEDLLARPELKTSLQTLLGGFAKLLRATPGQAPAVARLYATALPHPDAAVQGSAARGLAALLNTKKYRFSPADTAATVAAIGQAADLLTPPARTALAAWLPAPAAAGAHAGAVPYVEQPGFVPDLSPSEELLPVADWHELLYLTGEVLHHQGPLALARWLEGMLRLRPRFPADFAVAMQPYARQALPQLPDKLRDGQLVIPKDLAFDAGYVGLVQALVLGLATGLRRPLVASVQLSRPHGVADPLLAVEKLRLGQVERLLMAGAPTLPLLSSPTHAPHWLAPHVLVDKLLRYQQAGQTPSFADLAVALARTAHAHPASAAAARARLPQLRPEGLRELLTWLLAPAGTPLPAYLPAAPPAPKKPAKPAKTVEADAPPLPATWEEALPALWAVAARTKEPAGEFPALAGLLAGDYAGVAQPWQPAWSLPRRTRTAADRAEAAESWTELLLVPTPVDETHNPLLLYSLHARPAAERQPDHWMYLAPLTHDYPFLVALLPHHPDPLYWHTIGLTARRDVTDSTTRDALNQGLRSLLPPSPTLGEAASLLLAVGLTHNASNTRALALEAFITATEEHRLDPAALGRCLARLLAAEYAPVPRLSVVLAQARAMDPEIDDALRQTLDALLPALPTDPPRNLRKLLEAYADLLLRVPRPLPAPVRERLAEWQKLGSLRKVADGLLAH